MTHEQSVRVKIGRPGPPGAGITEGEKASIVSDIADLKAVVVPSVLSDMTDVDLTTDAPASGDLLQYDGTDWVPYTPAAFTVAFDIPYSISGGGDDIVAGIKGPGIRINFAATITGWTMLADQLGSIVVDIWKDTYANFPPTDADSITASATPAITLTTKNTNTSLTGWTTAITAGDILRFNVDSATDVQDVTLTLHCTRTVGP